MKLKYKYLILLFSIAFACFSCINDPFSDDPNDKLTFSADTLRFDTIFSTIPSRTAKMVIHNRNNKALNISRISLGQGKSSVFRFNIDGFAAPASNELQNIVVGANDSVFLYVEITPSENNETRPVCITDNLIFEYNSNRQNLVLEAYGQDVVILRNHTITANTTFTSIKPYLIFGNLYVPDGVVLNIGQGTIIYMHTSANIVVEGNIIAQGTYNKPITITGDRFDMYNSDIPYNYLPNQWGSIYIQSRNGENCFVNTIIKNGNLGVLVLGNSAVAARLKVANSVIHNMLGYGIYSQFGDVEAVNSEISNCGSACIMQLGGSMKVVQSTIANYPEFFNSEPSVHIQNYIIENKIITPFPIYSSVFENTIIFGTKPNEIVLKDTSTTSDRIMFNVLINNCLVKGKILERPELQNIIWSYAGNVPDNSKLIDTMFVNTSIKNVKETGYFNFQLAEHSRAIGRANYQVAAQYPCDLIGRNRLADGSPDLGAYERME